MVDTTAPFISLYGDSNITHEAGTPYIDANASWSDAVDGFGVIVASGEINTSEPATYVLSTTIPMQRVMWPSQLPEQWLCVDTTTRLSTYMAMPISSTKLATPISMPMRAGVMRWTDRR